MPPALTVTVLLFVSLMLCKPVRWSITKVVPSSAVNLKSDELKMSTPPPKPIKVHRSRYTAVNLKVRRSNNFQVTVRFPRAG